MYNVIIKNLSEVQTHGAQFESLELAQEWIDEVKPTGAWGRVAGSYPLESLSEAELATEISRETNEIDQVMVTIPDQFTVEIEDISAQIAEQAALAKAEKAFEWAGKIIAKIRYINLSKNISVPQFMAIMNDPALQDVERFIMNTSFKTAKAYLEQYVGEAYTVEEKNQIIAILASAIAEVD